MKRSYLSWRRGITEIWGYKTSHFQSFKVIDHLVCCGDPGQAHPVVVDLELVHPVRVRHLELGHHVPRLVLHGHPHEGVDPHELHLHVLPVEGHPLALHELLDHDGVDGLVLDGVVSRRPLLALLVVADALNLEDTGLLKAPVGEGLGQGGVTAGHLLALRLHLGREELVAEELEAAGEDDPGVVPGLEAGDHDGLLAHGVRVLGDGEVGVVAVGGGAAGQDLQDEGIGGVREQAHAAVEQGRRHAARHLGALDEVSGRGNHQRVLALVLGVVVEVVDDAGPLLVRFETDLEQKLKGLEGWRIETGAEGAERAATESSWQGVLGADLAGDLPERLAQLGVAGHQQVPACINELCDGLGADGAAELLHGGCEDDEVVVQLLAELLQGQAGVVGYLEGEVEALVGEGAEIDGVGLLDGEVLEEDQDPLVGRGEGGHGGEGQEEVDRPHCHSVRGDRMSQEENRGL